MPESQQCDFCPLPAVCFGADLAAPRWRCPRCCHRDHHVQLHGPPDYLMGHEASEGIDV